jgi:hypothetical protein
MQRGGYTGLVGWGVAGTRRATTHFFARIATGAGAPGAGGGGAGVCGVR